MQTTSTQHSLYLFFNIQYMGASTKGSSLFSHHNQCLSRRWKPTLRYLNTTPSLLPVFKSLIPNFPEGWTHYCLNKYRSSSCYELFKWIAWIGTRFCYTQKRCLFSLPSKIATAATLSHFNLWALHWFLLNFWGIFSKDYLLVDMKAMNVIGLLKIDVLLQFSFSAGSREEKTSVACTAALCTY